MNKPRIYLYIVYKTMNKINKDIYVGVHKTFDLENDCYYGSGKYILSAIDEHGKWNFEREVLFIYHSEDVAYKREKYIVNREFLEREDTLNIRLGGKGGWDHCHTVDIHNKVKAIKELKQRLGLYNDSRSLGAEKSKITNLRKYGVENCLLLPYVREKEKATKLKKYGRLNFHLASYNKEVRIKAMNTITEKYGNSAGHMHVPEVRERAIKNSYNTLLEKYGSFGDRMNDIEVRDRMRETKIKSSIDRHPRLLSPCILESPEGTIIVSGTVLDVCTEIYGRSEAVSNKHTILNNLDKYIQNNNKGVLSRGKYKGYKIKNSI